MSTTVGTDGTAEPREFVVIELAPEPVHYGWRQPSMSRRGGVRLHPVKDGVLPMTREAYIRRRDMAGNKLQDVIDPVTGFCIGVRSALMSNPNNTPLNPRPGTSGSHNTETARADVTRQGNVWLDDQNRVIRTCDMGDDPLPVRRTSNLTQPSKGKRMRDPSAVSASIPGATGPGGRITDADCDALIIAMAKGRPVKITQAMRAAARDMLKQKRAEAAKFFKAKGKK